MTGGGGLTLASATSHGKCRWVGRAGILSTRPHLPQWIRYLAVTVSCGPAKWQGKHTFPSLPPLAIRFISRGADRALETFTCRASPFLLSLGVSKSMMSVVFLAGPLSGLIVQPLVGVLSDGCKSRLGRRRPFIIGGCILTSLSVMTLGWSKEIAALFANEGTKLASLRSKQNARVVLLSTDVETKLTLRPLVPSLQHNHLAIACAVISVYVMSANSPALLSATNPYA
jgi:hypothetical protein